MMPESGSLRLAAVMAPRRAEAEEISMSGSLAKSTRVSTPGFRRPSHEENMLLPGNQDVANLTEEFFGWRGCRRRRRRRLLAHPGRNLHHLEQDEGDDQEIDKHGNEIAIGKYRALLPGRHQRRRVNRGRQANKVVAEVEATENRPDDRHDQIVDDGVDDLAKGGANDDADGQIERIAFECEFLEFLPHLHSLPHLRS